MSLTSSTPSKIAQSAAESARSLLRLPLSARNDALTAIHDALLAAKSEILAANAMDMAAAVKAAENGELSQSLVSRLDLSKKGKFEDMLKGVLDVRGLDDPINKPTIRTKLDDNLTLERVTCPIGVLLIIFEARPEVIANIASLAIKSGNAAILKGGKESTHTFISIATTISHALTTTPIPPTSLQLVTTRASIDPLLREDKHINLVIPRGSNALVRYITSHTSIPVLGHADGLCSIYLCADADPEGAKRVLLDAKCWYPAACNAVETLLVDEAALSGVAVGVVSALLEKGVSLRCDAVSKSILASKLDAHLATLLQAATEEDYDTEFLSLTLALKTVPSTTTTTTNPRTALNTAIAHINAHSSHHTDAILTASASDAEYFMTNVDSAGVFWNTSTRMADGMRYGFGTEVGISTNKIHARGPVGLEGLTSYKYKIRGSWQGAGEFGGAGREFVHVGLPLN